MGNYLLQQLKKLATVFNKNSRFLPYTSSLSLPTISKNLKPIEPWELLSFGIISRAFQLLANDIAKLNWCHFKNVNNESVKVNNSIYNYLLNFKPNNEQTAWEFKKIIVWNILLYGGCYLIKFYDNKNQLTSLYPVPLCFVQNGNNGDDENYLYININALLKVHKKDAILINYELIQGFNDANVCNLFKSSLAKIKENELTLINAIANDISASVVIKINNATTNANREAAELALHNMIQRQKSTGINALVVDEKWDIGSGIQNLGSKIDFNVRNAVGKEVCAVLGIPPAKLGIDDSNKYNSSVELNKNYVDNALKPLLLNIFQRLSSGLFDHFNEKIDFRPIELLSLDISTIKDFAASGINNGYLTPNEVRSFIGLEKINDGDQLLINSTLIPIDLQIKKVNHEINNLNNEAKNSEVKNE